MTREMLLACKPAAMLQASSGKPAKLRMFLRGMPFEPPRAGMRARISVICLSLLHEVESQEIVTPKLPRCPPAIYYGIIPRHVRGCIGCQKQQCSIHFIFLCHASQNGLG